MHRRQGGETWRTSAPRPAAFSVETRRARSVALTIRLTTQNTGMLGAGPRAQARTPCSCASADALQRPHVVPEHAVDGERGRPRGGELASLTEVEATPSALSLSARPDSARTRESRGEECSEKHRGAAGSDLAGNAQRGGSADHPRGRRIGGPIPRPRTRVPQR